MPAFTSFAGASFGALTAPPAPPSPPTPTVISTSLGSIFARVPECTVEFSKSLLGPWTEQYGCWLDRLRIVAAPEIDQATLTWHYGTIMWAIEDQGPFAFTDYAPLEVAGKYVRITIKNWWTDPPVANDDIVWHGVVETETLHPNGNSSGVSTGTQTLTCYGLLRLAERKQIATTFVENYNATDMLEINRGLKFNEDERGEIRGHGNRSATKQTIIEKGTTDLGDWDASGNSPTLSSGSGTEGDWYTVSVGGTTSLDGNASWSIGDTLIFIGGAWKKGKNALGSCYLFSWKERGQAEWSAYDAAEYMIYAHCRDLTPGVTWAINITSGNLQWNPKGGIAQDRRNVKAMFDELISRHRGVGYYTKFDPASGRVVLTVFSFSNVDINMPNGETFDKNPNQYSLDFEASFDVTAPELNNTISTKFHRVVVEGDWMTSTATLKINTTDLVKDWTADEQQAYMDGASNESWYAALTRKKKNSINRTTRNEDRLRNVFSRFAIGDEWDLKTDSLDGLFTDIRVFPKIDTFNGAGLVSTTEDWTIWNRGLTVTDKLPLRERYDYSDAHIPDNDWQDTADAPELTPFLEPFSIVKTQMATTNTWELLDKFDSDVTDQPGKRKWHVNTRAHNDRAAVLLNVVGGPQHFLGRTPFVGAANADYDADDAPQKNHGIDYDSIAVTLCFEFSERARIERHVSDPADGELERVLRIHVEDCRLDYVVPNTVVGVKSGELQYSDGGFVRDDRLRLDTLCKAAAQWYGIQRQTLELTYKQVREIVQLGWLIVDVGRTYQRTGVNSVVTAITYDIQNKSTSFQTAFAELDLL